MYWNVIKAKSLASLALSLQLADCTVGTVQFEQSHLTGGFASLKDPRFFQQVHIDNDDVAWPGNIDLAPDAMYLAVKSSGEWVPS